MEIGLRLAVSLAQIAAVMGVVMLTVMVLTLAERKVLGWMQDRMGPMEVGPYGVLQPADGLEALLREDIIPAGANRSSLRWHRFSHWCGHDRVRGDSHSAQP